jgi:hypothetical protein
MLGIHDGATCLPANGRTKIQNKAPLKIMTKAMAQKAGAGGGGDLTLQSGDPAVAVDESRNASPEHSQDESGRKHIEAVQPGRSHSPSYAVEDSKDDDDADAVGGKRAHCQSFFFTRPACWIK